MESAITKTDLNNLQENPCWKLIKSHLKNTIETNKAVALNSKSRSNERLAAMDKFQICEEVLGLEVAMEDAFKNIME